MAQMPNSIASQKALLDLCNIKNLHTHKSMLSRWAELFCKDFSTQDIADVLKTDAIGFLAILKFVKQENENIKNIDFSNLNFKHLIAEIPTEKLTKLLLSQDCYENLSDYDSDSKFKIILNTQIKSGLRAFTAEQIAEKTDAALISKALLCGLLADVGLIAMCQCYTKSMTMLYEQAQENRKELTQLEIENFGTDDAAISEKILAKLGLPKWLSQTVWLQSKAGAKIFAQMPDSKLALIVKLADYISDIKSHNNTEILELAALLNLTAGDVSQLKQRTADRFNELKKQLPTEDNYSEAIKKLYFRQSQEKNDSFGSFAEKFNEQLNPELPLFDIIETSAALLAKSMLARKVCIFIPAPQAPNILYAYTTGSLDEARVLIETPDGFDIKDTTDEQLAEWLFAQIGIDAQRANYLPITAGTQTVAGLIFSGPMPQENLLQNAAKLIGKVLSLAIENENQKRLSAIAMTVETAPLQPAEPPEVPKPKAETKAETELSELQKKHIIETAAELAAGAAHELNNPLAVLSGRAQLLLQNEADETKQQILKQILEKTEDIEHIIAQLMCYAQPPAANRRNVSPFILINNCIEKVQSKYLDEPLDINVNNIENLDDVLLDTEQISEALAQIIYNALESYESGSGPVQLSGTQKDGCAEITIVDYGCGMDGQTLARATEPFYSNKSAGRQRGMGLSIAAALLQNNNCTLDIQSKPETGTTVIITMPNK